MAAACAGGACRFRFPPPGLDSSDRRVSTRSELRCPRREHRAELRPSEGEVGPDSPASSVDCSRVTCFFSIRSGIVGIHRSAWRDGQVDECMPCF
ncbi:hypothetical protein MRX96_041819 [Rhipicephalus microplus]